MPLSLKMSGKSLAKIQDRIDGMIDRVTDMTPAWARVVTLTETMMAAVWAGGGMAPEFGMMSPWSELSGNPLTTVARRAYYPTPHIANPVLAFGFLRAAALTPLVAVNDIGTIININPAKAGAPASYARGNYAKYLQEGTSQGAPARPFFQVTPQFLEMVKEIMVNYIMREDLVGDDTAPDAGSASFTDRERPRRHELDESAQYAKWRGKTRDGINYHPDSDEFKSFQEEYSNTLMGEQKLQRMSGLQARSAEGRNVMQEASGSSNPNDYIGNLSRVLEFRYASRDGRA